MTIQLSPALERRVAREAKARGLKPKEFVEAAVKAYLKPSGKTRFQESASRKRLRELTKKSKTSTVDFDTAVREARAYAHKLYQDNEEFIEMAAKRYRKPPDSQTK